MRQHDSKDFEKSAPLAETPFYVWLGEQKEVPTMLGSALRQYYGAATKRELKGHFKPNEFQQLQRIFHHFQWQRLKNKT
jgi:hypothetical protein